MATASRTPSTARSQHTPPAQRLEPSSAPVKLIQVAPIPGAAVHSAVAALVERAEAAGDQEAFGFDMF